MEGAGGGGARMRRTAASWRWWVPGLALLWLVTGCERHQRTSIGAGAPEDAGLATVPWQTLWLLQSSEQECDYQEAVMRPESNLLHGLQSAGLRGAVGSYDPIGHCPVRFQPHVDPHRWLPRNLIVSECLCEGSSCARHSLHVCVTVFAVRTVYGLYVGRRRVLLPVGCLCAVQKARFATAVTPNAVE